MYDRRDDDKRRTGGGKPYDLSEEEWDAMSVEEKQVFFDLFRARVYAFWMAEAAYQKKESERRERQKSRFRVDEPLK